jgi:Mg2+/Co2+ transporter CorC
VTVSDTTTKTLVVEVLTRKTNIHMTIISLIVAYGGVAGLIGLTIEDYKRSARPSYREDVE